MKRTEVFTRDGWTCVYCGVTGSAESLSIDHLQPRIRGGDDSGGNVVTACLQCNALKGSRSLPDFLATFPVARRNFLKRARYVWPRHMRAVAEELVRRGIALTGPDFVEGVRGLRGFDATAGLSAPGRIGDTDEDRGSGIVPEPLRAPAARPGERELRDQDPGDR